MRLKLLLLNFGRGSRLRGFARNLDLLSAGLLTLAVLLILPVRVSAQEFRSNLTGQVTDQTGRLIPNANVTAVLTDTSQTYAAKTSSEGVYYIPYVLPGTYTITVKAEGFQTAVQQNVLVLAAQSYGVNFRLEVGSVRQAVTVTSTPPIVDTASGSGGDVLQANAVSNLPTQGRTLFTFLDTIPGNTDTSSGPGAYSFSDDWSITENYQLGGNADVNGDFNSFILNGVNVTAMVPDGISAEGSWDASPNVDAIQEVNVMSYTYDARYGRTGGGVVNMVVKSGTNSFHGDAYDYWSIGALDAATFTDNITAIPTPNQHLNDWGFTIGGPIKKDKMFFFGSLERQYYGYPYTVLTSVPTAAMRSGNFSGTPYTVYNPATTTCTAPGGTLGDCAGNAYASTEFPGDVIPTTAMATDGQDLANLFPLPNINSTSYENNFADAPPAYEGVYQPMVRADYDLTNTWRLNSMFEWEGGNAHRNTSGFSGAAENGNIIETRNNVVASLGATHTFSPTFVGEFSAGFARLEELDFHGNIAAQTGLGSVGLSYPIAGNAIYPNLLPQVEFSEIYPQIIGNNGAPGIEDNMTFSADFTKSKGRNNIEFGVEFGEYNAAQAPNGNSSGAFEFGTSATQYNPLERGELPGITDGNVIADLLLGDPVSGDVAWSNSIMIGGPMWDIYAQDNIRVNHRLTVNVGLRYDVERGLRERYNRINSGFCLSCVNPITSNATYQANLAADTAAYTAYGFTSANLASLQTLYGGITFPSGTGSSQDFSATDWADIGPRIGLAYMITPKTVVRGGWGWLYAYDGPNGQAENGFSYSTPYVPSLNGVTPDTYFSSGSPFPSGIEAPTGNSEGLLTNAGNSTSLDFFQQRVPRIQVVSLGVQRELPGHILLDVKYAGNYARNLELNSYPSSDFSTSGGPMAGSICGLGGNAGLPELGRNTYSSCVGGWYSSTVPNPFYGVLPANSTLGASQTISAANLLRGYPEFNQVEDEATPMGKSWYDSLQVIFNKRLYGQSRGLSFQAGYVFSRSMQSDTFNDPAPWQGWPVYEDTPYSRTNMLTASSEWDLPMGKGSKFIDPNPGKVLGAIINNWKVNWVFTYGSGIPEAVPEDWTVPGYSYRPPNKPTFGEWLNNCSGVPDNCFLPMPAYAQDQANALNRVSYLHEPTVPDLDLTVEKNIPIMEGKMLQFRADMFNFTNTPLFGAPNTSYTAGPPVQAANGEWSGFGTVSFAQENFPRMVEFVLKVIF